MPNGIYNILWGAGRRCAIPASIDGIFHNILSSFLLKASKKENRMARLEKYRLHAQAGR